MIFLRVNSFYVLRFFFLVYKRTFNVCRKKLDETTIELRKSSKELELEKVKTDTLLYQMLPEKVANDLKNGRPVKSGRWQHYVSTISSILKDWNHNFEVALSDEIH